MGNRVKKKVVEDDGDSIITYYVRDAQGNMMATYRKTGTSPDDTLFVQDKYLYGSSRLGSYSYVTEVKTITEHTDTNRYRRTLGYKSYELSNHLGNVLVTVTDQKIPVEDGRSGNVAYWNPKVVSYSDYYPFGMLMPGRQYNSNTYRFGFNGKESDDEVYGKGNVYDYGFRIYNPQIGRFLSVDPLFKSYPHFTPYQFSSNMPIAAIDVDGLEAAIAINSPWHKQQIQKAVKDGDVQRAIYLANKSITTERPPDKKNSTWVKNAYNGADYAGTFNYNEMHNLDGLTVYDNNGNMLFNVEQMDSGELQKGKVAEESSGTYLDQFLDWIGFIDNSAQGSGDKTEQPAGIWFTTKNGQGQETKVAADPSLVDGPINIDLLLETFHATKATRGTRPSNVLDLAGDMISAYETGEGIREKISNSESVTFKCEACAINQRDSFWIDVGDTIIQAVDQSKTNIKEKRETHH